MSNVNKIIGKLKIKKIMTWTLMWFNWSVATINATFQLLDMYRYRCTVLYVEQKLEPLGWIDKIFYRTKFKFQ